LGGESAGSATVGSGYTRGVVFAVPAGSPQIAVFGLLRNPEFATGLEARRVRILEQGL
jgi:hypothetical protein